MFRFIYKPSVDYGEVPKIRMRDKCSWVAPPAKSNSFSLDGSFSFLNKRCNNRCWLGWPDCEKLWRYNQHYFDCLNSIDCDNTYSISEPYLMITPNTPGIGVGWEPYPTSIRIINWIKWSLSSNQLRCRHVHSLAIQTRWLSKNIEWHLLGNHLFANAKALVFAGLFFHGDEAEGWLSTGLKILESELEEQVLSDGGHFELSPMYHCIFLEDVLDLVNLLQATNHNKAKKQLLKLKEAVPKMFRWLQFMCHPDEKISFFNDASFNVATSPADLRAYAKQLNIRVTPTSIAQVCI